MSQDAEPHRYGDREAALILRRAAALGEPAGAARAPGGLTLAELQEIAAEAGIDSRHVAEAAAGLPATVGDPWGRVLGAPTRWRHVRTVEGTLPDEAWRRLLEEVRSSVRTSGLATHLPGSLDWRSNHEAEPPLHLRASSGEGATRLELDADLRGPAFASIVIPTVSAAVLGSLAAQAGLGWGAGAELWTALTAAGGGAAAGWGLWRRRSRRWRHRLDTLMGRLAAIAAGTADATPGRSEPRGG